MDKTLPDDSKEEGELPPQGSEGNASAGNYGTLIDDMALFRLSTPSLAADNIFPSPFDEENVAMISWESISVTRFLGSGYFGDVYLGNISPNEGSRPVEVAMKMSNQHLNELQRMDFSNEMRRMSSLEHAHVTKFMGWSQTPPPLSLPVILMEYLEGQDLRAALKTFKIQMQDCYRKQSRHFLRLAAEVASACDYLGSCNLIHRDIAARNVLLTSRNLEMASAKIGDFGMARHLYGRHYYKIREDVILPLPWCAPETLHVVAQHLNHQKQLERARQLISEGEWPDLDGLSRYLKEEYKKVIGMASSWPRDFLNADPKFYGEIVKLRLTGVISTKDESPYHSIPSDMWSFGVLLYEILTLGGEPFLGFSAEEIIETVVYEQQTLSFPDHHPFSPGLVSLIRKAWNYTPSLRPTFKKAEAYLKAISRMKCQSKPDISGIPSANQQKILKDPVPSCSCKCTVCGHSCTCLLPSELEDLVMDDRNLYIHLNLEEYMMGNLGDWTFDTVQEPSNVWGKLPSEISHDEGPLTTKDPKSRAEDEFHAGLTTKDGFPVLLEDKIGSRTLTVLKGDIFSLECDTVVVCKEGFADQDRQPIASLLEEGDKSFLDKSFLNEVTIASSATDKAAHSIHILHPMTMFAWWFASRENSVSLPAYLRVQMPKAVSSCLGAATSLRATSIAFPLFGTGRGALPKGLALTSLLSALHSSIEKMSSNDLSQIFLVLF